jgi:hypothetical protein
MQQVAQAAIAQASHPNDTASMIQYILSNLTATYDQTSAAMSPQIWRLPELFVFVEAQNDASFYHGVTSNGNVKEHNLLICLMSWSSAQRSVLGGHSW